MAAAGALQTVNAEAPVRPIVFTTADAPDDRFQALSAVADVVVAGVDLVEPSFLLEELERRGHLRVHCEGGPTFAGLMLADDAVDELCLTLSPTLEGGDAGRITGEVARGQATQEGLMRYMTMEKSGASR